MIAGYDVIIIHGTMKAPLYLLLVLCLLGRFKMFDVAIPLVVELVLSAFYILPSSSSPASFVLVFLLIFFLSFSLRLPLLTVILLLECVRSTSFVWFLLCV